MEISKTSQAPDGFFRRNFRRLLTSRSLPVMLAVLAIVLTVGSIWVGWFGDDHIHRHIILDTGRFGEFSDSRWDLFRFCDGEPERNGRLMDAGILPWWTYRELKVAFWRPITAVTHWGDYQLWPDSPMMMHAHSVLWYGALAGLVALLYRRFLGLTLAAGLAGLMWAVEDAHGMPIGFLANRNILVSALFGVLALIAHDRWRRDRWTWGILLGPLCFLASLLSKEMGVATMAYIFSYAVFIDEGSWWRRIKPVAPYILILVAWRVVWSELDYGVLGIGMYIDPLGEPLRFAGAVFSKAPIFLLAQFALPPADVLLVTDINPWWLWGAGLVFVTIFVILLIPLFRRDRTARFWALAMVLSVVPACSTTVSDRLLFFVGIGAMGLMGQFVNYVFNNDTPITKTGKIRLVAKCFGVVFVLIHLILAPAVLALRSTVPFGPKEKLDQVIVNTEMDDSVTQQDLIVVNPPHPMAILYLPSLQELKGQPVPQRVRVLASGYPLVEIYRIDDFSLRVRPTLGFMPLLLDQLFRGAGYPFEPGEKVELIGMTVEVTELNEDRRPAEAVFRFDVALEDSSLRWLYFDEGEYKPFALPAVGEVVELRISDNFKVK